MRDGEEESEQLVFDYLHGVFSHWGGCNNLTIPFFNEHDFISRTGITSICVSSDTVNPISIPRWNSSIVSRRLYSSVLESDGIPGKSKPKGVKPDFSGPQSNPALPYLCFDEGIIIVFKASIIWNSGRRSAAHSIMWNSRSWTLPKDTLFVFLI